MPTDLAKIFPNFEPLPKIHGGVADSSDVNNTREHMANLKNDLAGYYVRIVTDLNENLPGKTIDMGAFWAALDDAFGDHIGGPLMRIAEQLDEDETEARGKPGSYLMAGE